MPGDAKKNQQSRNKNDPKEQRRPKQSRNQSSAGPDKKENPKEHSKEKVDTSKVPVTVKPIVQEPGPEFYQSLKRETEEILKISEEANTKYSKKEIYSNWQKYELPIESYDEIEEQEDIGADYEQLIQTPMATGGHFQFKHEKSWESVSTPSEYDKYFEIDMEILPIALMALPFYVRNNIDTAIFSQGDISNMKHRAMKFGQKYDEIKSTKYQNITTTLTLTSDARSDPVKEHTTIEKILEECKAEQIEEQQDNESHATEATNKTIDLEFETFQIFPKEIKPSTKPSKVHEEKHYETTVDGGSVENNETVSANIETLGNNIQSPARNNYLPAQNILSDSLLSEVKPDIIESKKISCTEYLVNENILSNSNLEKQGRSENSIKVVVEQGLEAPKSNPVIQSSEDLEKWLDDFLDS